MHIYYLKVAVPFSLEGRTAFDHDHPFLFLATDCISEEEAKTKVKRFLPREDEEVRKELLRQGRKTEYFDFKVVEVEENWGVIQIPDLAGRKGGSGGA